MQNIILAFSTILIGVGGCLLYFWGSNFILDAIFPARGKNVGRNINRANAIRPWLFLAPAVLFLGLYLVMPVLVSINLSFKDKFGENYIGFGNYKWMWNDPDLWLSLYNNALWFIVVPAMITICGLLAASLTDRIKWGNIAKSLIFMPMAISFIGASVIWKFVYEYRPADQAQVGLLNKIVTMFGGTPEPWLNSAPLNSFLLMVVLIWIQTGFAMVILSAALRGIPEETVEAAVIDGATPLQIFFKIKVPQIIPTIMVVWTTNTILVLKVFDIVLAMTGGLRDTEVLANYMYRWLSNNSDYGKASAIAMVIMVLVIPVMIWNIRTAVKEN